jgi:hypothetical protein
VALAVVTVGLVGPLGPSVLLLVGAMLVGFADPSLLWWADSLLEGGRPLSVLVSAAAAPLYAVVAPTWLFLAGAVSSLRTEGTDGSRPLKLWFVATAPAGALIISLVGPATSASPRATVALYGALAAILSLGAVVLAAHPRSRRRPTGLAGCLLGDGPSSGARVAVGVTVVSLAIAWLADLGRGHALATGFAALVVLGFVVLLAGSGVALSRVLKPAGARMALVGVGLFVALAPLAVALAVQVASPGGDWESIVELSPLGSLVRLADEARRASMPFPPFPALLWLLLGALAWAIGANLRRDTRP